jgi:hypothetical protein
MDVRYFMPNNIKIQISRPPQNKLPMVDFSYRPLFTCLSVENIIKIFECLCAELTVCICSDNLSLLTPVQEGLLSFLFPVVWQGIHTCICIFIYRYAYIYIHIHVFKYTDIHSYIHISINTYLIYLCRLLHTCHALEHGGDSGRTCSFSYRYIYHSYMYVYILV